MKALDFDSFFEEVLKARLAPLEAKRQQRLWALWRVLPLLAFVLVTVANYLWFIKALQWWGYIIAVVLIGVFVVTIFHFFFSHRSLPYEVEDVLQASLSDFLGNSFKPKAGYIPHRKFEGSKLFSSRIEHYDGENYFVSDGLTSNIMFSELRASLPMESGWKDIFWGLFFVSELMLPAKTPILIIPNEARQGFGFQGDAILEHHFHEEEEELVNVLANEADQRFAVYAGEDKVAQGMLNKKFLDALNRAGQRRYLKVAVRDSAVYVAVHLNHNWLQPDVSKKLTNPDNIRHYYEDAAMGIELCKALSGGGVGGGMDGGLGDIGDLPPELLMGDQ